MKISTGAPRWIWGRKERGGVRERKDVGRKGERSGLGWRGTGKRCEK